jgi:hypothetical protein
MTGRIVSRPEPNRATPYHPAHTTTVAGLVNIKGGDDRFYSNIFVGKGPSAADTGKPAGKRPPQGAGFGLGVYDHREFPLHTGGNVFYNGAQPYAHETQHVMQQGFDPKVTFVTAGEHAYVQVTLDEAVEKAATTLVTTDLLGKAKIPGLPYEHPDGSPLKIDTDYFGKPRNAAKPTAGPFENPGTGPLKLKVW